MKKILWSILTVLLICFFVFGICVLIRDIVNTSKPKQLNTYTITVCELDGTELYTWEARLPCIPYDGIIIYKDRLIKVK